MSYRIPFEQLHREKLKVKGCRLSSMREVEIFLDDPKSELNSLVIRSNRFSGNSGNALVPEFECDLALMDISQALNDEEALWVEDWEKDGVGNHVYVASASWRDSQDLVALRLSFSEPQNAAEAEFRNYLPFMLRSLDFSGQEPEPALALKTS